MLSRYPLIVLPDRLVDRRSAAQENVVFLFSRLRWPELRVPSFLEPLRIDTPNDVYDVRAGKRWVWLGVAPFVFRYRMTPDCLTAVYLLVAV